jgi:hypothetical protein
MWQEGYKDAPSLGSSRVTIITRPPAEMFAAAGGLIIENHSAGAERLQWETTNT